MIRSVPPSPARAPFFSIFCFAAAGNAVQSWSLSWDANVTGISGCRFFVSRWVYNSGMDLPEGHEVTQLLYAARNGDQTAENELFSAVYGELRKIARYYTRKERPDHSLNTTALVHEAYLRLISAAQDCRDRTHFFAVAARVMRRILVDRARNRLAEKRGSGGQKVDLENVPLMVDQQPEEVLDLDEALLRLREFSPRQESIVELRFFSGMTEEEVAEHLRLSIRTVRRDWKIAKAWLYGELKK